MDRLMTSGLVRTTLEMLYPPPAYFLQLQEYKGLIYVTVFST